MKPRGGEGQNGRLKCPMGFLVDFYFHLKHYRILRALKRDLTLDILITVTRNTFLFAQRGGNPNCEVIYACKHFSIKMRDESKRDFKGHTLKKIN